MPAKDMCVFESLCHILACPKQYNPLMCTELHYLSNYLHEIFTNRYAKRARC